MTIKPRILHVAGHLRCQNITAEGLCSGLDPVASVDVLRRSTGTSGEQDFTADMAQRQADVMNATSWLEARTVDAAYDRAQYIDWKPDLVIAHHIHRDGNNRAMFAIPDNSVASFHSEQANRESFRFMQRVIGGYERNTGIPVQQHLATLRMTQLYTWCYIDDSSQAMIAEYGNGNIDTQVLFGNAALLAAYMTACVLEHFNLTDVPPHTPTPGRKWSTIADDLVALATEIRQKGGTG